LKRRNWRGPARAFRGIPISRKQGSIRAHGEKGGSDEKEKDLEAAIIDIIEGE